MKEFLETYSPTEILVFIVMAAIALKWIWEYREWLNLKLKGVFVKEQNNEEAFKKIDETLTAVYDLGDKIMELNQSVNELNSRVDVLEKESKGIQMTVGILLSSDKDDIKSWITEKHQKFLAQGWIDPYSLDCLEKRFTHYLDEGGNSFIEDLMEDIRALPRTPQK